MAPLTIFLGKLMGVYCVIVALALMTNRRNAIAVINALIRNAPLLFVVDIFTVILGLAAVIGHNYWSGGALPVVVTLVGWMTLGKGLLFLLLSQERTVRLYDALRYEKYFFVFMSLTLALGLYLTVAAFGA